MSPRRCRTIDQRGGHRLFPSVGMGGSPIEWRCAQTMCDMEVYVDEGSIFDTFSRKFSWASSGPDTRRAPGNDANKQHYVT